MGFEGKLPYLALGRIQVLTACWPETSVPSHMDLFMGQLITAAGFPQNEPEEKMRERARGKP